jgi:hypothetical protein
MTLVLLLSRNLLRRAVQICLCWKVTYYMRESTLVSLVGSLSRQHQILQ